MDDFNNVNGMNNDETSGMTSSEAFNNVEGSTAQGNNSFADTSSTGNGFDQTNNNTNDFGPYTAPVVEGGSEEKATLAIVSLVCGIASIIFGCCCGIFGTPLSIAAVITGIICKKNNKPGQGMALAGIITGAVGIVVFILSMIFNAAVLFGGSN